MDGGKDCGSPMRTLTTIVVCSHQHGNHVIHANRGIHRQIKKRFWCGVARQWKGLKAEALAHVKCYSSSKMVISQYGGGWSHGRKDQQLEWIQCADIYTHSYEATEIEHFM